MGAISISQEFLALVNKSSLDEKRTMLEFLRNEVLKLETNVPSKETCFSNDINNILSPPAYKKWVSQSDRLRNFHPLSMKLIDDENFLNDLRDELESINLYSLQASKPKTMSFALCGNDCPHNGRSQAMHDLSKYPAL